MGERGGEKQPKERGGEAGEEEGKGCVGNLRTPFIREAVVAAEGHSSSEGVAF